MPRASATLDDDHRACARLQRRRDPTFWAATGLLPAAARQPSRALYAWLRAADDVVDDPAGPSVSDRERQLRALRDDLDDAIAGEPSPHAHPACRALADAAIRHDLPVEHLDTYLASMRIDLRDDVRFDSIEQLDAYMAGSAAAVGWMMAPLIGMPADEHRLVAELGVGFQLTNFLRDAGHDARLGRRYLPGVDERALAAGRSVPAPAALVDRAGRSLLAGQRVARHCPPAMRPGIRLACRVYRGHLARVRHRGLQ